MEVLSKLQLQVRFELKLYLYLLLHVPPTWRHSHTLPCSCLQKHMGSSAFLLWILRKGWSKVSSKFPQGKEILKSRGFNTAPRTTGAPQYSSAGNQMQALNWHHIKLLKNWQAEHPESTISLVTHPEIGTVLSLICCLLLSEIGFWWCKSPTIFWSFLCGCFVCHAYLGCSFLNCTPSTILSKTLWHTEQHS